MMPAGWIRDTLLFADISPNYHQRKLDHLFHATCPFLEPIIPPDVSHKSFTPRHSLRQI